MITFLDAFLDAFLDSFLDAVWFYITRAWGCVPITLQLAQNFDTILLWFSAPAPPFPVLTIVCLCLWVLICVYVQHVRVRVSVGVSLNYCRMKNEKVFKIQIQYPLIQILQVYKRVGPSVGP